MIITRLSYSGFFDLPIWINCPRCRHKMKHSKVRSNFGFVCHSCDYSCELASLLPEWVDV